MKKLIPALLAILVLGFSAGASAGDRWGDRGGWRGGGRGHDHHHGSRSSFNLVLGAPLYWPSYSYYRPYPYRAYGTYGWYGYPQPPVIVQQAPVTYVQREAPPAPVATQEFWYYCPDTRSYYPYAQTCPSEWLQVVPQTSPQ